ncbi:MAG TPA: phosphatase PAP2 family protein [Mycobacteriales bacterium]|nr:phosphatase PAP2 family protein [Mycobacteriales bacterium]
MTVLRRADRRLAVRLTLGLAAALGLGVPFLLLALLVRAHWSPLISLDTSVAGHLHAVALRHGWLVTTLKGISDVFDPIVFRVVTTVIAGLLLWQRRFRLAAWTLVTIWGAALLGLLLKIVVDRTRPDLVDAVATAPGRSFPSGHALTSTVGSLVLLLLVMPLLRRSWRVVAVVVAIVVPLAVGFARIGLGVHFLSDVVAGEILGLTWVAVTAAAFEAWRRDVGLPPSPPAEAEPELGEDVPEPSSG